MDIVEELRRDRESGAKRLETEYKAGLMTLARRFCNDEGDAEELVNRTFAEVINGIDDYLEQSAFFAWMCQILVNLRKRDNKRKSNKTVVYPGVVPEMVDDDAQEAIYRNLDYSLLRDAIAEMPTEMRELLLLHYFMEIPIPKLAKILAVPAGTVKSRLHYARSVLAAKMGVAVKKPGGKAVLLALLLCGITALGAAVWNLAASGEAQNQADTGMSLVESRMSSSSSAEVAGQATCDMRQTEASNLSTFQPFNFSTDNPQGDTMNISKTSRTAAMLAAATLSTGAAADTLYWAGGTSGTWDDSTECWTNSASSTPRPWQDGSDAIFAKDVSGDHTVTVSGNRTAKGISGGGSSYTFKGSGTISWTDWFARTADTTFSVPLTDNGGGLRFDAKGSLYFKVANTHTGGTWVKGSGSSLHPFAITIGDKAFGAVPAQKQTNIVWQGGNVALYAENGAKTLHANRTIRVVDGVTFWISTGETIEIKGDIVGDVNASSGLPSGTSLQVGRDASNWTALAKLSGTNSVGRIKVLSQLEIAGGRTSVATASAADNDNAPIYIVGNGSSYKAHNGRLLVSGGELVNTQSGTRYFETQSYGQLDVAGGSVIATNVLFLNGYGSPGKVTVRDGGLLHCGTFRLSQTGTGTGGELFLCTNGVLRVNQIGTSGSAGAIHFNGGRLQRTSSSGDAIANASGTAWNNISFLVEAGGAVLDTSNGNNISFPKPLSSGVADGETDGGLTCILSGGRIVLLTAVGSTYNGPTRLEGPNGTLQCRTANVLPAGTTLQVGPGTTADFSSQTATPVDMAQTVARLEGGGTIANNSNLMVTGAVAPVFDDTYGTLTLNKPCSLSGDLEIKGDASGCGCVKFAAAGQSIASLSLKVEDISLLSKNNPRGFYKIVDAPSGYSGTQFAGTNLPSNWQVRYENNGIYLSPVLATVISLR
ncbi:MAG: sigma-70 family RNA polymerase sigma factor [Kiritimatiellae bacterium]|nr:sigma-70 family RNA polymerase sigma factor [Kiritimatiellia bacterium]